MYWAQLVNTAVSLVKGPWKGLDGGPGLVTRLSRLHIDPSVWGFSRGIQAPHFRSDITSNLVRRDAFDDCEHGLLLAARRREFRGITLQAIPNLFKASSVLSLLKISPIMGVGRRGRRQLKDPIGIRGLGRLLSSSSRQIEPKKEAKSAWSLALLGPFEISRVTLRPNLFPFAEGAIHVWRAKLRCCGRARTRPMWNRILHIRI